MANDCLWGRTELANIGTLFDFRNAKDLSDDVCLQKAGNKPADEKTCEGGKDCARWHIGQWNAVGTE